LVQQTGINLQTYTQGFKKYGLYYILSKAFAASKFNDALWV